MLRKLLLFALIPCSSLFAQDPVHIGLEMFATGLTQPVDIANAGDDRLFVVQRGGSIKILSPEGVVSTRPFLDISDQVTDDYGEQGLLGLAFDPDYATNGEFYVYYTTGPTASATSIVSRFTVSALDPDSADVDSEEIIYSLEQPYQNHNGGDIAFGPDGYFYIGFGDGGSGGDPERHAQDLTDPLGDLLRIDVHGDAPFEIPPTNPWVGVDNDTLPEIWASGLRNPWRWGFDAETGDLWIGDVGQGEFEEVDFWPAGDNSGANFGWRCYEGNEVYSSTGCASSDAYVQPVSVHTHGDGWISVIGGRVYRGTQFPHLNGHYFYSDHAGQPWFSLFPNGSGGFIRTQVKDAAWGGLTSIGENNANELFATRLSPGQVYRIVDECPMDAPVIVQNSGILTSTLADTYAWYLNGDLLPGLTTQSILVTEAGSYYVVGGFNDGLCSYTSDPLLVIESGLNGASASTFTIYPVPARDEVVLSGLPAKGSQVRIMDMAGRSVASHAVNGKERASFSVTDLANASYIIQVNAADGTVLQQHMLQVQR